MTESPVVPRGMPLPDDADGNANVAAETRRNPLLTPPAAEERPTEDEATPADQLLAQVAERQTVIEEEIKRQQKVRTIANATISELREEAKLNTRLLNARTGRKKG